VTTKIPRPLQTGDVVALVNPAGILPKRFEQQYTYIVMHLETLGFTVLDLVIEEGWQNPRWRAAAIMQAFLDPRVKAILPLCGGKHIYDVLPYLDYPTIAEHPKILCGSSEFSALTMSITEKSDIVTFTGPHLSFLNPRSSKRENRFTERSFWNMLQWDWHGKNGLRRHEAYHFFRAPKQPVLPVPIRNIYREPKRISDARYQDNFYMDHAAKGHVEGKLLAGSLEVLLKLCQAGLKLKSQGKILVLDALDMSLTTILSLVQQLHQCCPLTQSAAIVFSALTERTDRELRYFPELQNPAQIRDFLMAVSRLLGDQVPLYHGLAIGHCAYKLTVPNGILVSIIRETGDLLLMETPYE